MDSRLRTHWDKGSQNYRTMAKGVSDKFEATASSFNCISPFGLSNFSNDTLLFFLLLLRNVFPASSSLYYSL